MSSRLTSSPTCCQSRLTSRFRPSRRVTLNQLWLPLLPLAAGHDALERAGPSSSMTPARSLFEHLRPGAAVHPNQILALHLELKGASVDAPARRQS